MKIIIKQLWLVVVLILAASALLLVSDLEQRSGKVRKKQSYPLIAVMQIASTTLLDTHVEGIISRLEEKGYKAPDGKNIVRYNAQGDFPTASAIARDIANSPYDLVITSSTVALQAFSRANVYVQKPHVFGAVTDPYGAGVGISGPGADQHPPYMSGIGTFQPVKSAIIIAKEMNPLLKRLGVVWNPGEQCSEACLKEARQICGELDITLEEAIASNTTEVAEAARSLVSKNIDAVWVGGDSVAIASIGLIINIAGQSEIPVFTNDPSDAEDGALFGLGADYFTVGQYTGDMAAAILEGKSLSSFRIENVIPEKLVINKSLMEDLGNTWKTGPTAEKLLAATNKPSAETPAAPEKNKTYKIAFSYIVPAPIFDIAIRGFKDGLKDLGFIEGQNLELIISHSNGDMSLLPQTTKSLAGKNPDILVALSTPSLASAIAHSQGIPVAFGIVSAPLKAGAGKSFDDHLPHVTGIVQLIPTEELFDWTRTLFPGAKQVGALYNPSEANSAKEVIDLEGILDKRNMELVKMAVYSTGEVPEAILGLLAKNVDLVFAMGDNTVANAMPAMVRACRQNGVPIIAEDIALMGTGAVLSCAPGPYSDGREIAGLTARILAGTSPEEIAIKPGKKNQLTIDMTALKKAGARSVPYNLLKRADVFFHLREKHEAPAEIIIVNLVENASLGEAINGVKDSFSEMGLRPKDDYTIKEYCAQGDMTQLAQILDRVAAERPDVLITVSTPVLIAAAKRNFDFPVVFTVASDPEKLGLFEKGRPENICGIHDDPPVDQVLEMARKYDSALDAVGIIYDPSQSNSLISVEKLRSAGKKQNIKILEATIASVSDIALAARAIIQSGAKAIIVSADNLAATGFAAIHKAAQNAEIPVYTTDVDLVDKGAAGAVGDSYYEWGLESGKFAVRIIAGLPPGLLPVMATQAHHRIEPADR